VDVEITSDHQRRRERRQSLQQVAEVVEERLRHAAGASTVDDVLRYSGLSAFHKVQWLHFIGAVDLFVII